MINQSYSFILFVMLLIVASFLDWKKRTIPNYCSLLLLLLACITEDFSIANSLIYMLSLTPIIFLFYIKVKGTRVIGGGDVKLILSSGFYMKEKCVVGLFIAIHCVVLMAVLTKLFKRDFKNYNAFAPYLTFGFICSYLF